MNRDVKSVLLIFNPYAASRRASKHLRPILDEFKKYDIEVSLRVTKFKNEAIEIIIKENFDQYDALVAAGGDGTLFEIVNGLFRRKEKTNIPLGIIPIGTGNAFARDLNVQTGDISKAVSYISNSNTRKVDVGCFNTAGEDHFFLNVLGLGFIADVTKTAFKLKWMGNIAYTLGVLWKVLFLKKYRMTIKTNGIEKEIENTFIEISNSRYTSNFLMAPNADISDGLFDVTILNGISRFKLFKFFPKVFTGEHINLNEIMTFKTSEMSIHSENPELLAPDGELIGITPINIKCLPGSLTVFCEN